MKEIAVGRRVILGVVASVVSIGLLAGGWLVADVFQSPAQRDAAARPPAPAAVTATVVNDRLSKSISARATMTRESTRVVSVTARGDASVVTKAPIASGAEVNAGAVILEVDGRPMFALPGSFALYRDLSPGMAGPDVTQLQTGLRAAGYDVTIDGSFGPGTERVLRALYARSGYSAPAEKVAENPADAESARPAGDASPGGSATIQSTMVVPRQDFLVVAKLPAFAGTIPAVGTQVVSGTTLSVEEGAIVAVAKVAASAAAGLKPGTAVSVERDGVTIAARVRSIDRDMPPAPVDSTKSAAPTDTLVTIVSLAEAPFDPGWLHSDVLAEFQIEVIADSALIVPSRSVTASADGTSRVLKQLKGGSFHEVRVKETGTLDGRSAVSPLTEGELAAGDLVKVG